jgi:GT2 family glycosyltransferase
VSVVVSTYNRSDRLGLALEALLAQAGAPPYEVIVVDNNSSDGTRQVVSNIAATAHGSVTYAFEPRQGLSYGRNTGIHLARAQIVAFTDDDVRVAPDWIAQMERAFREHPDATYVGGRVLPHWLEPPPRWLTTAHWSPLALQDYGEEAVWVGRERAVCLVGASLAFRRAAFDRVGLFTPALGRIKDGIGSTEDHDMQLRLWRAGMHGLYAPDVRSSADVTPDRMRKEYHRRWHRGHGRHCALMRLREHVPADLGPMIEPGDMVLLFGSPAFVYSEAVRTAYRWLDAVCRRKDSLFYANRLLHTWGYLRTGYELFSAERHRTAAAEVRMFLRAYARKRMARAGARHASA